MEIIILGIIAILVVLIYSSRENKIGINETKETKIQNIIYCKKKFMTKKVYDKL